MLADISLLALIVIALGELVIIIKMNSHLKTLKMRPRHRSDWVPDDNTTVVTGQVRLWPREKKS